LIFRPLTLIDLEWFIELRNDVREMLHNPKEFNLQQAIRWLPESETKYWIINVDGRDVGYFRVLESSQNRVLIGADISPEYQGKRLATLAYPKFVEEILIPRGYTELELRVLKKNIKAIKLYKNLGFVIDDETSNDYHMIIPAHMLIQKDFEF
jgi:RimJ/RimL family protein N-acetyltransferase